MRLLIVGIDCATKDSKVGLALAEINKGELTLRETTTCTRTKPAAHTIANWLRPSELPALLAIDAPLGWPASLGRTLQNHQAGHLIDVSPNELFRRVTDRFVQQQLGKTPLDVGADRIARTAHAALKMLAEVSGILHHTMSLVWTPDGLSRLSAIEVYPAATLVARNCRATNYKKRAQFAERREIISEIRTLMDIGEHAPTLEAFPDALDATICVVAAKDFLDCVCPCPADRALAEHEGWIWTRLKVRAEA